MRMVLASLERRGRLSCQNDVMDEQPALQPMASLLGLRSNAGPLRDVAIAFGPGVTALYGQNGAGKTWILNSLRRALRGYYLGITQLICEFEPGSAGHEWALKSVAETARERRRFDATVDQDRERLRDAIETWFVHGGKYFKEPYEAADEVPADLVDELSKTTTFALIPTGSLAPEWDVWLCMPRDAGRFPACARAVKEFTSICEEIDQEEDRHTLEYAALEKAVETGELTDEQLAALASELDQRDEELGQLAWSPLFEPLAGLVWEYSYLPDPSQIRRRLEPMVADDLPIPVVKLFTARDIPLVLEDDDDETDLDAATAEVFAAAFHEELNAAEDALALTEDMKRWAAHLEEAANAAYSSLLQDAPRLMLEVRKLGRWAIEGAVHWQVAYSKYVRVPVAELSRAESRWARIAVRRALDLSGGTSAVVIDEPEAALHRVAERHMARGLDGLTTLGPQVVVATHSPEVLNTQSTGCIHVAKHDGLTHVGQMPHLGPETLAELGLSPSDLLGLYRIFLLVEGEHDAIVIETLCREFLDAARVKIIPMRGGKKLPGTIESQLLFDLSDAHLVAVLDSVRAEDITAAWMEAQTRYLSGDAEGAIDFLAHVFNEKRVMEHEWITKWLSRALQKGVHSRMNPYGLAARDIVEYLPVGLLVPKADKPWDELRREHDAAMPTLDRTKRLHEFKTWLTHTYKADISVSNVRRAAESVTEVPEELWNLGYHLREISSRPRGH